MMSIRKHPHSSPRGGPIFKGDNMFCPKCGADLGNDYAYNAAFDVYNFKCPHCSKKFLIEERD